MLGPLEDVLTEEANQLTPESHGMLRAAHRNALRLQKLVNTLLDFSRIEAGRVQASYRPTDISGLTSELASNFRSATEKAGLQLVVECPPLPVPTFVDRDMWEKIVLNLLSNSFKHTFEGEIRVKITSEKGKVTLTVSDTGVGIPSHELPHLFERFHRVPDTLSRTYEGSGIGLALVNELVKLHGGTITVESQIDQGTTFTVIIPTGKEHLPADRIDAATTLTSTALGANTFVQEMMGWMPQENEQLNIDSGSSEKISHELFRKQSLLKENQKPRILVAEDNRDMLDYIHRLLDPYCDVETVLNGKAALNAASANPPDLILSDVMMPEMDGFQLLSTLRSDSTLQSIPVILLSARAGEEAKVEGLQAGADDYLVKPFSSKELVARVQTNLALSKLRRQTEEILRESEQRFKILADQSPMFVWMADEKINITYANKELLNYTGFSDYTEFTGRKWEALVHPEDLNRIVEIYATAIQDRKPYNYEGRFQKTSSGEYRWVLFKGVTRYNHMEEFAGYIGTGIDIHDQKVAELSLLTRNDQLIKTNNDLDNFIYTASHDLKAPISNLEGLLNAIANEVNFSEEQMPMVEMMFQSIDRFKNTITDLTEISKAQREGDETNEPLSFSQILEEVQLDMSQLIQKFDPVIEAEFEETEIKYSRKNLRSIVYNLLSNALKYSYPDRRPHVKICTKRHNDFIIFQISDNGLGLSEDNQNIIFGMFKRAHQHVEGTGVGLYMIKRMIENTGGKIEVESEEGKGTTFRVYFRA